MISTPIVYLFILSFISAFFVYLKLRWSVVYVFVITLILSYFGLFEQNRGILNIYNITQTNIIPAMLFLTMLHVDMKNFFNTIGCACTIGAKRYWLIILLSIFISLICQTIAFEITEIYQIYLSSIIAIIFGIVTSYTKLRDINGISEVATSMFYVLVALEASMLSLYLAT